MTCPMGYTSTPDFGADEEYGFEFKAVEEPGSASKEGHHGMALKESSPVD